MKIIDQTPFFNKETGEISILDRGKAMMKFGAGWMKEVEAQNQVIPILDKVLDKEFTLLRNVTPSGLGASFPFILVGPTGVFVMYVAPVTGEYRAKGDQWGTISGNTFRIEKTNLLTRTERMARAIQVFLQRQGYIALTNVDAILLCSDPAVHVDSIRPIIRVVMRDALERFAISIMQARVVLSPESVQDVIERILNPPKSAPLQPEEVLATTSPEALTTVQTENSDVPAFTSPESKAPAWINEPTHLPEADIQSSSPVAQRSAMTKKQWSFLIIIFVIWFVLISVFLFLVIRDQWSFLLSLLP